MKNIADIWPPVNQPTESYAVSSLVTVHTAGFQDIIARSRGKVVKSTIIGEK
jgi:hypothetical protein